ncbi:MAG: hypothetical protein ACJAT5_000309 [Lentimonas sp.]|jgi:hypothetical protein
MKHFIQSLLLILLSTTAINHASAEPIFSCCATDDAHIGRPDEHAPISVMGDHTHGKGGWMVSYRYMQMHMDGMRQGNQRVSSSDVFDESYAVTPESMTMDMHMLGFMYGLTDKLTLTVMGNHMESEMEHRIISQTVANGINGGATEFTTNTSGIGDIRLGGLYRFYLEENSKAHLGLSLSVPTGSIEEKDRTPGMGGPSNRQLPAPMQLGSGTFDLMPSLTFVQQFADVSYGIQTNAVIRLEDENNNGYRLGNAFGATTWTGYKLNDWIALNTGLNYTHTGELEGTQEGVSQNSMVGRSITTAFGENYGGERLDLLFGVNCYVPKGLFKNHRVAIDIRLPLWQDLNGYQLETDFSLTIGLQKAF